MTTLSDTPTSIPSVAAGISIKIEQGVLYEDNYDEGSKTKVEMRDAPKPVHDSNLLPAAGHMFNITHSIFQSDFSIKTEPEVDIDDRQPDEEVEEKVHPELQPNNDVLSKIPKIRPTPTNKLIANWVSGNKRRFACTYENCTKSYGKSSHLRSHLTWHTGIKPFVCKEPACGKGFTRSDELNRHIRTHTGEKPFECVKCTKKFSRSDHLTKHLATHSKQLSASPLMKKLKTENNVSFSAFKTLLKTPLLGTSGNQNSQEMHLVDRFEPNIDCLKAASEESLIIKQEITESNADCMTNATNRQENLNLSFPSEQGLLLKNDYNVVIKPEPAQEPQVSQPLAESNEPDDDAIMPEANLPPILQNSTSIPVFKSEESSLLKVSTHHMADSVYDPTRPFPCCHCTKNFKRQDDLNRHMRTHTGEKPFACIECEKRFMRSDHLKKHIKTHARTR